MLRDRLADWRPTAERRIARLPVEPSVEQLGRVLRVGDGIAAVAGLPDTRLDELLDVGGAVMAVAGALDRDEIGCVLLGDDAHVRAGQEVRGTGQVVRVPVGDGLLGRVVDPLGRPLDGAGPVAAERRDPIERAAPGVAERGPVTRALHTGVLAIDAMLPLGRGQRELIVGDRGTGKTAIAVDAIVSQRDTDVVCVYAAVGQKASTVTAVIEAVRAHGAPQRCVFVVAESDSAPGLQWLAPYAACTIAEQFRDRGRDALIVFDDLSKHAAVHRQLSLLLRSAPGREAYPGDVFYLHARLLERAAQLSDALGGGSLTALPIAETQAGNLTAYIPTNLVSITDGQIVTDPRLFHQGHKPAIDAGLSVSRVGGRTQPRALRRLAEHLRLEYAQYLELEVFTRFGGLVDERTRATIEHGRRIRAALRQRQFRPLRLSDQVAVLLAVDDGVLDRMPVEEVDDWLERLGPALRDRCRGAVARIDATGELTDTDRADVLAAIHALAGGATWTG